MRKSTWLLSSVVWMLVVVASGCGSRDTTGRIVFHLSLAGLHDLGPQGGVYEGWAVVGTDILSTGKFRIDESTLPPSVVAPAHDPVYGTTIDATFGPANTRLGSDFPFIVDATQFFVTIEPEADNDRIPSGNVVLAGSIFNTVGVLTASGLTGSGGPGIGNLASASGSAIVTNATGVPSQPQNGIWFTTDATGTTPSLNLPPLSGSWTYEAWATNGTTPVSLGRFRDPTTYDDDAQTSITRGMTSIGFRAPGADFATTVGAPGIVFPTLNHNGSYRVEITVEPVPDNSANAFPLALLSADIPTDAVNASLIAAKDVLLSNGAGSFPAVHATFAPQLLTVNAIGTGLPAFSLPQDGTYEFWVVVGGQARSVSKFVVQPGTLQVTTVDGATSFGTAAIFQMDPVNTGLGLQFPDLTVASEAFVTVEPQGDPAPAVPGPTMLDGAIFGAQTTMTVAGLSAIGGRGIADFSSSGGTFITRTPTDDAAGVAPNDDRGVWFRTLAAEVPSLTLPTLPADWTYEAWVVGTSTGGRWSLGKFRRADLPDDDSMTFAGRGTENTGFRVPGQDFLNAVPFVAQPVRDFTANYTVFVTVEPVPDNAPGPFFLRVLQGPTPLNTQQSFPLVNPGTAPSGLLTFTP